MLIMRRLSLVLSALALPATLSAQQADFHWDKALPAGRQVRLQNVSGDVTVTPSTSGKVEVAGIHRGGSRDDELTATVAETADGILVCVVHVDGGDTCDDRGYHSRRNHDDWNHGRMDLEVKVPANLEVWASSVSGQVRVTGAQGRVRASSVSGDVVLQDVRATTIRATSVSGDVEAHVASFTGSGGLSFKSVSGDVTLELPKDFAADLAMSSVSGQLDTDFPLTLNGRMSRRRIEARIGSGGRDLEVSTVSGDVRLRMVK